MTLSEVDWVVTTTIASLVAVGDKGTGDTVDGMWLWSNWSRCWLFWAKKSLKLAAEILALGPPLNRLLKLKFPPLSGVGQLMDLGG